MIGIGFRNKADFGIFTHNIANVSLKYGGDCIRDIRRLGIILVSRGDTDNLRFIFADNRDFCFRSSAVSERLSSSLTLFKMIGLFIMTLYVLISSRLVWMSVKFDV